ncbi:MAG: methyltransferase domain-containing protein [Armatimonadetes bacterium]|nr:methyltransferase domain-containing protein [Armatimonadota bacterium]
MFTEDRYYLTLAAAFVRGRLGLTGSPLETLSPADMADLLRAGQAAGLRLHKFKRTMGLPRVRRVLGLLHGLRPTRLLDIGCGRGTFLWPLLEAFPTLPVTAADTDERRVADAGAIRRGGLTSLTAARTDATRLAFGDNAFDVVTLLETLEHIPDAPRALAEAVRVARRFVVLSVPSHADDNPQHLHLFPRARIADLFAQARAERVSLEGVLNHLIAVARLPAVS